MSDMLKVGEISPFKIPDMDQHQLVIGEQSGLVLLTHVANPRPIEIDAYDFNCERLYYIPFISLAMCYFSSGSLETCL